MTDNVITIKYIAQVSMIYAEENVYTWTNCIRNFIWRNKKFLPFFRNQILGLFQDSDWIFQDSKIHD